MSKLTTLYRRFRTSSPFMLVGHNAECALDAARTLLQWEELEAQGLVKLECEPNNDTDWSWLEQGDYSDEQRERWQEQGAFGSIGSFRLDEDGEWTHADSVGGHVGYRDVLDPHENCYIIDIMRATLDALEAAQIGRPIQL